MELRLPHSPHGQQAAQSELVQAGVRHKVACCWVGASIKHCCTEGQAARNSHDQGVHAGGWGRLEQRRGRRSPTATSSSAILPGPPLPPCRHSRHQHWPPQVKLFFDGQGPKVLQRARGLVLGIVVHRPADEHPVLGVHRAGCNVGSCSSPRRRRHPHVGRNAHRHQRQACSWQQTSGAPGIKCGQVHSAGRLHLAHQVPGDEVARYDEKDVHANVPSCDVRGPDVEAQDQEDGDSAQGLDVGAELGHGVI